MEIFRTDRGRKTWHLRWPDHKGIPRKLSSKTRDEGTAKFIARNIDVLVDCRKRGQTPPSDLLKYLNDTLHPSIRARLVEWGIVEGSAAAAGQQITQHIVAWRQAILDRERGESHADTSSRRVAILFGAARIDLPSEITSTATSDAIVDLRNGRVAKDILESIDPPLRAQDLKKLRAGLSPRTCNHYLRNAKDFCTWMRQRKIIETNPLDGVKGFDQKVVDSSRVYNRRPLTPDEQTTLLSAVAASTAVLYGLSGSVRHLVYLVALYTGIRPLELKLATRSHFYLDGDDPTLTIPAKNAKAGREDILPLHPCLVEPLKAHLAGKMPGANAFDLPHTNNFVDMFRTDLAEAGIADTDDQGRRLDFYSLRHSYGTNLARAAVPYKIHMELMRHREIATTLKFYVSLTINDRRAAVQQLRGPGVGPVKKVGAA